MAKNFDAILPTIIPLLLMQTSSADGEVLNAVHAMLRALAREGFDIHALVEHLKHGSRLSAGEMQKIYDAAYQKGHTDGAELGRRSAVLATAQTPWHLSNQNVDDGVNGYTWQQIAEHCLLNKQRFHGRNLEFVESIFEQLVCQGKSPSPPQAKWLRDLFMRMFAGRIE